MDKVRSTSGSVGRRPRLQAGCKGRAHSTIENVHTAPIADRIRHHRCHRVNASKSSIASSAIPPLHFENTSEIAIQTYAPPGFAHCGDNGRGVDGLWNASLESNPPP